MEDEEDKMKKYETRSSTTVEDLKNEKNHDQENESIIKTINSEIQTDHYEEIEKLKTANILNLEKKDEIIQSLGNENEELKDEIAKLKNELKIKNIEIDEATAAINGNQLIIEEYEGKEKQTKKENKQVNNELKTLKETVDAYKIKSEDLEGQVMENITTINSLNDYIRTLKNVNREAINRSWGEGKNNSNYDSAQSEEDKDYQEEINQRKIEENTSLATIYIGNLDQEINEEVCKTFFELEENTNINIKYKERKRTKRACKYEYNCKYGRSCKWLHMNELNESIKYAEIEVPQTEKDRCLNKDGEIIINNKIIVEEVVKNKQTNENTRMPECRYYKKGNCRFGNKCKFRHENQNIKYDKPCKYYSDGHCRQGTMCKYKHNIEMHGQENQENNYRNGNKKFQVGVEERITKLEQLIRNYFQTPQAMAPISRVPNTGIQPGFRGLGMEYPVPITQYTPYAQNPMVRNS